MQQTYHILILPDNRRIPANAGASLFDVLGAQGLISGPCGKRGLCGKCGVDILNEHGPTHALACQVTVTGDMTVRIARPGTLQIPLDGPGVEFASAPMQANARHGGRRLGAAFDLGTTTLACALLDLDTGKVLAVCGAENPQCRFGADVMTRLLSALEGSPVALQKALTDGMRALVEQVCAQAGANAHDIRTFTVAGNTAMQHLLLGYDVSPLSRAPYAPLSTEAVSMPASALGLSGGPDATLTFLPLIAGFVGADTTACLLSTHFDRPDGITLLVDIGTNGELVLGSGARRIACSTAAGPAFEGASLTCGMRAETGAIDACWLDGAQLCYSVIGGGKPRGVCGSGLVMLVACLLAARTLAPSGRLESAGTFKERCIELDGQRAFIVADATESADNSPVLLTQKDVRALQLAKAAIASGTRLLCRAFGVDVGGIDRVLLAGGFGASLDVRSACSIGLLPQALGNRVTAVGNASLAGAALAALHARALPQASALARTTAHLALAKEPDFEQYFLEELAFPEATV